MARTVADLLADPTAPSFTGELLAGRFRWDLMATWPVQDAPDAAAGDQAVRDLRSFLTDRVDPETVERTAALPDGFVADLKGHGWAALGVDRADGGRGLSPYNTFRVIEAAAGHSLPVAMTMAIDAAIGVGAYLPALPDGPLRDLVRARLRAGVLSGTADTEPTGAANRRRYTTATPTPDGRGYLLSGEKVHVGNAPVADLLWTTATTSGPGGDRVRTFLVDMGAAGVQVRAHRFMGLRGFPNGRIRFTDVEVPAAHVFPEHGEDYEGRITPAITVMLSAGRLYLICAPSLAIGRGCVEAMRGFAARRSVDGRRLGAYPAIRQRIAASRADLFTIQSVVEWSLLAGRHLPVNPLMEQNLAKNICSLACWRIVERAMAVLAAEGFETAASKTEHQIAAVPVERHLRDARGLRISGGVDFLLDYWFSDMLVFAGDDPAGAPDTAVEVPDPGNLSGPNAAHLRAVAAGVRRVGQARRQLSARYPARADLADAQQAQIALGAIYRELVTMSVVLARAAHLAAQGDDTAQPLADIACVAARRRLEGRWRDLAGDDADDGGRCDAVLGDTWLYGGGQ